MIYACCRLDLPLVRSLDGWHVDGCDDAMSCGRGPPTFSATERCPWRTCGAKARSLTMVSETGARIFLRRLCRRPIFRPEHSKDDAMEKTYDYDNLSDALDEIAAWLLAAYGPRLARISLTLEGYYSHPGECYGIVPITLDRGVRSDGSLETRESLPSHEVRDHAEALLARLVPDIRCTRESGRDVREVASSRLLAMADVSAHQRMAQLRSYGRLPDREPDSAGRQCEAHLPLADTAASDLTSPPRPCAASAGANGISGMSYTKRREVWIVRIEATQREYVCVRQHEPRRRRLVRSRADRFGIHPRLAHRP